MLQHVVLLSLKDPRDLSVLEEPMALITGLAGKVPGILKVAHGPNRDLERKSERYQYGLIVTVTGEDVLADYMVHPDHQAAGKMLVAACVGGADGIFVADIACEN